MVFLFVTGCENTGPDFISIYKEVIQNDTSSYLLFRINGPMEIGKPRGRRKLVFSHKLDKIKISDLTRFEEIQNCEFSYDKQVHVNEDMMSAIFENFETDLIDLDTFKVQLSAEIKDLEIR